MKYIVLIPNNPVDPRGLTFSSPDELYVKLEGKSPNGCPGRMEASRESEIVRLVRLEPGYEDAMAMLVPVKIGSSKQMMLGVLKDPMRKVDVEEDILFEMLVRAEPESGPDVYLIKKDPKAAFDRNAWKLRPVRPDMSRKLDIELRATDLEVPTFTEARVGYRNGRTVIYVEIGGIEMSIEFRDPGVQIERQIERAANPLLPTGPHAPGDLT